MLKAKSWESKSGINKQKGFIMEDGSFMPEAQYFLLEMESEGITIIQPLSVEIEKLLSNNCTVPTINDNELSEIRTIPDCNNFIIKNSEFCGSYKFMENIHSYYKMNNSDTGKDIYIEIMKDYWNGLQQPNKVNII